MYNGLKNFLTLPGENLLFAKREHVLILLIPICCVAFLYAIVVGFISIFVNIFFPSPLLVTTQMSLLLLLIIVSLIGKLIADWYFHLYVITNRKILEVSYRPFFYKNISAISLDQVRCIETTVKTHGLLKTLLDIGDVSLRLDMLTHESTFVLSQIATPHRVGVSIGDGLNAIIFARSTSSSPPPLQQEEDKRVKNFNLFQEKPKVSLRPQSYIILPYSSMKIG